MGDALKIHKYELLHYSLHKTKNNLIYSYEYIIEILYPYNNVLMYRYCTELQIL